MWVGNPHLSFLYSGTQGDSLELSAGQAANTTPQGYPEGARTHPSLPVMHPASQLSGMEGTGGKNAKL